MDINNYKTKFKLLFDKLLKNNFEISSYYAENFIRFLENSTDKDTSKLLESPFFSDLILHVLSNIEQTSQSVKIFVMNLLTLVTRNEVQFGKLNMKGFYLMAERHNLTEEDVSSPAFRLAIIKQATAQIQHSSGLYWNIEHHIWEQIYNSCYENQPDYLLNASYNFLKQFIWKLNELDDEGNLMLCLGIILKPVLTSEYKDVQYLDSDIETSLIAQVKPALMTVRAIMDTAEVNKFDKAVHLMARYFILEAHLYTFSEATRDPQFAALTSELYFLSTFAMATVLGSRNQRENENEFSMEGIAYFNILYTLIQKRMIPIVIEFSVKSVLFWWKFGRFAAPRTFQRYGRTFGIDIQLIIILLVPLMVYAETPCQNENKEEGLTNYIQKLTEISSEQVIKGCYLFKDLIEESDKTDVVILALRHLTRLKGHLTDEQAGTIFQALFYVLKRFVPTDESGALVLTERSIKSVKDAQVLSLVLSLIKMILTDHNVNWYDSCEVICLYNYVVNLLKPKTLDSKLVMEVLDLINLTVKKFLPPDLNLLMESKTGSVLNEIGDTIRVYMGEPEWEVRDSALQLLCTCTQMAFNKYIPFQKLILSNSLIRECAVVACTETEMYCQASALRTLTAAVRLQTLWNDLLEARPNLNMELAFIVRSHSEGIVRKEAVATLIEIFANQKVTLEFKRLVYCTMYTASLDDLHWEVQLAAITFWKRAIQNNFANRGMIDGKFPNVTFSREKKKIITLNEMEIHRILTSILTNLAHTGCLSVLTQCMNEDFSLNVIEHAYSVVTDLLDILNKYNFERVPDSAVVNTTVKEKVSSEQTSPMDLSFVDPGTSQEVMESILNTNLADLIDNLCETQENTDQNENYLSNVTMYEIIHPNEFIDGFRNGNYLHIIEEKKKYNSGVKDLNDLIDEMISLDGTTSSITVECS